MRKIIQGRLSVFKFESFKKYKNIAHFITTKEGWVSGDKPRFTGDDEKEYAAFRKELAVSGDWEPGQFVFPRQTHSDHVVVVRELDHVPAIPDTDALITNQTGIFVCIQTADCVPVLLFDPERKVVAAVHAGWKGTIAKIAGKTVEKMVAEFGCDPADIVAGIGPSIHIHNYEVGSEVVAAVESQFSAPAELLKPSLNKDRAYFDLWEANRVILAESGVLDEKIEVMGLCSFEHSDMFFSARREGAQTGRMVTGIMLK